MIVSGAKGRIVRQIPHQEYQDARFRPSIVSKPVSDKNKGGEILILEEQDTTSSEEPKTKISSRRFKEQNKLLSATKILQVWQPMFQSTQGS
ncbi:hypothetical protein M8J77_021387 [Diaphorina citri]|nr:hypothetical protein M8J77_021387 [Diaphorina citri]